MQMRRELTSGSSPGTVVLYRLYKRLDSVQNVSRGLLPDDS